MGFQRLSEAGYLQVTRNEVCVLEQDYSVSLHSNHSQRYKRLELIHLDLDLSDTRLVSQ